MNHRHQLSTTAAADGLQLGSGLRRIVCLAALLFIFAASGVRAANYVITIYDGCKLKNSDLDAINVLSILGQVGWSGSGNVRTLFTLNPPTELFDFNQSTLVCSVPTTITPANDITFPVAAYRVMFEQAYPGLYYITLYDNIVVQFQVAVNEQNFPDTNFRNWVKAQSYGSDGILTKAEIAAVTGIDVSDKSISSLKGIEYFTALTELKCFFNQLTELDVSKNTALEYLYCYDNQLKSLDVSKNTALIWLYCSANQLTSLDVSNNTALTALECSGNQLKSLDVSKNTALKWLFCDGNQLTSLDVSNNTALYDLDCYNNQLTSLDVSGCTKLESLNCYYNNLTTLDVTNCTALKELYCYGNQLTTLDVSGCTALGHLECYINQLTFLNVSGCTALRYLDCSKNQLTSLDVTNCTALTDLNCRDNQLTTLNVSGCAVLKTLSCYNNQIRGTAMTNLVNSLPDWKTASEEGTLLVYRDETPAGNMMTKVQVKIATDKNWNVQIWDEEEYNWVPYEGETPDGIEISEENFPDENFRAYVSSEDIDRNRDGYLSDEEISGVTTITVSYHEISDLKGIEFFTALTELNCSYNQLTSLDVSHNMALTRLYCYCNRIRGTDMTKLVNSLPDRKSETEKGTLWVYYIDDSPAGNMMTTKQVKIAREKNWNVVMWDDDYEDFIPYEGETLDGIEISEANFPDDNFRAYVSSEDIDRNRDGYLSDDEIEAVTRIVVSDKSISSLIGIEYFTALTFLRCDFNQLTELDVSKNTALEYLYCHDNQLKSLDVSKNTALIELACGSNQLTELNVSKNTQLTGLACDGNQLKSLDVSKNTALKWLFCEGNELTSLDVSKNTTLAELWCFNNLIRGKGMTDLVKSLPDRSSASKEGKLYVYRDETPAGNLMTPGQVEIATNKKWSVLRYDVDIRDWVAYEGEIIPGDANGNGVVDAQDIATVRDYILGRDPQPFSFESANLNGDSTVDIQDLTQLIQLLTE